MVFHGSGESCTLSCLRDTVWAYRTSLPLISASTLFAYGIANRVDELARFPYSATTVHRDHHGRVAATDRARASRLNAAAAWRRRPPPPLASRVVSSALGGVPAARPHLRPLRVRSACLHLADRLRADAGRCSGSGRGQGWVRRGRPVVLSRRGRPPLIVVRRRGLAPEGAGRVVRVAVFCVIWSSPCFCGSDRL